MNVPKLIGPFKCCNEQIYIFVYLYTNMCLCIYMCICVHTHTHLHMLLYLQQFPKNTSSTLHMKTDKWFAQIYRAQTFHGNHPGALILWFLL